MSEKVERVQEMPYRLLGETGERVSAIGLGGFHIGKPDLDEKLSIRIIRSAVDQASFATSSRTNASHCRCRRCFCGFPR